MANVVLQAIANVSRRLKAAGSVLLRGQHYDNATTTVENRKHWGVAKDLPPIVLNDHNTRATLRTRARYESDNNCYCGGLISTLASDTIGYVAPVPQINTGNPEIDKMLEYEWKQWSESESVNLPSKLNLMDRARRTDGESFPTMIFDEKDTLQETGYSLNIAIVPQYRVCDPSYLRYNPIERRDGVTLINDDGLYVNAMTGVPYEYSVASIMDEVNGSTSLIGSNSIKVSSRFMKQWYMPKFPGQFRGICEIAASLGLYAQLRRFGLATLSAAEIAAMMTLVIKTNLPSDDSGKAQPVSPFSVGEFERGMVTSMPEGWEPYQMKAEHPISSYEMFVNMVLREIGRLLDVPFGIVAGDHSKYNYSSARLDVTGYDERKKFDRRQLCIKVLNSIMREFLALVSLAKPEVMMLNMSNMIRVQWQFTNRPSIAPDVDANVDDTRLKNGTTTLSEVYAVRGLDYREQLMQYEKEQKEIESFGIGLIRNQSTPSSQAKN